MSIVKDRRDYDAPLTVSNLGITMTASWDNLQPTPSRHRVVTAARVEWDQMTMGHWQLELEEAGSTGQRWWTGPFIHTIVQQIDNCNTTLSSSRRPYYDNWPHWTIDRCSLLTHLPTCTLWPRISWVCLTSLQLFYCLLLRKPPPPLQQTHCPPWLRYLVLAALQSQTAWSFHDHSGSTYSPDAKVTAPWASV